MTLLKTKLEASNEWLFVRPLGESLFIYLVLSENRIPLLQANFGGPLKTSLFTEAYARSCSCSDYIKETLISAAIY